MAEKVKKKFWQDLVKVVVFMTFYSLLHFLYEMAPSVITQAISGTNESLFQHMKIGVFAYFFTNFLELLIYRKALQSKTGFLYSRVLSNLLLPWLIFVTWYPIPTLMGQAFPATWMEVLYSILVMMLVCILLIIIERSTEKLEFPLPARIILLILFVVHIYLMIVFSFQLPYYTAFFTT